MNIVDIAVIICTYNRKEYIKKNLDEFFKSDFFCNEKSPYFGHLHIFLIDNGSELNIEPRSCFHLFFNRNTGGSGGFQRGVEEVRKYPVNFTHVIFMDDDVSFYIQSFYILFDFLLNVDDFNKDRPVAGRMFCMDKPDIQFTAAEKWNKGKIEHVEFMRNIDYTSYKPGKVVYDTDADYGGWWFCCYPMGFVENNDVFPFFIHCDDVEYGLRCGKSPIIIEGVQVWHETYEKRLTPVMNYYDTRNPLYVNLIHNLLPEKSWVFAEWKNTISQFHLKGDYLAEFYVILGMSDFLKGMGWLKRVDPEKYNIKLMSKTTCKFKNALFWRYVALRFKIRAGYIFKQYEI